MMSDGDRSPVKRDWLGHALQVVFIIGPIGAYLYLQVNAITTVQAVDGQRIAALEGAMASRQSEMHDLNEQVVKLRTDIASVITHIDDLKEELRKVRR